MRRGPRRATLSLIAAGLASAAFVTPAAAEPAGPAVHHVAATAGSVTDYWTPAAMRSAVPMEQRLSTATRSAGEVARGVPQLVPPVSGGPAAQPQAFPSGGEAWTGGGEVTKTAGRVFFTFDGQQASCSGDAVTSENRSVVITAGHCVKYQGSWHTNWIFVPGYDNGNAPYGEWTAQQTLTTPQWEASEDINYDVGAAVVGPVGGQRLTEVVGGQGIAFNQERDQDMYAFGYPAADPYDGSQLIYCSGTTFTDPLLSNDSGMSCDMTGGSSGGPWFLSFDESTGTGVQNSVNSFGYTFLPDTMFGPYFGAEAQALYQEAQAV